MLCSATGLSLFSSPKCLRGERPCSFVTATLTYFTSFSLCGRVEKGQTFLYLHFWHTLRATRLVAMVNRPLHMNVGNKLLGYSNCHYLVDCLTFVHTHPPPTPSHSFMTTFKVYWYVCPTSFGCRQLLSCLLCT